MTKISGFISETPADNTKIIQESKVTTDKFAYSTYAEMITYLSNKGYLTQSEIEALTAFLKASQFTDNESVLIKNSIGDIESKLIADLETAFPKLIWAGFDFKLDIELSMFEGRFFNEHLFEGGFNKNYSGFSEGSGNGCLDTPSLVALSRYKIMLINKVSDPTIYDIFVYKGTTFTVPTGWLSIKRLGVFYTDGLASPVEGSEIKLQELIANQGSERLFTNDYYSNFSISWISGSSFSVSKCFTIDSTNTFNQKLFGSVTKSYPSLDASKFYYIFQVSTQGDSVDYEIDDNKQGTNITKNKRLIGRIKTDKNGNIKRSSVISIVNDKEDFVVVSYFTPLTGVLDNDFVMVGENFVHASGLTAGITSTFASGGSKIEILINSITSGGTMFISGISKDQFTSEIINNDTESIEIDTSSGQRYMTSKNWIEINTITLSSGISNINYDVSVVGYENGLGTDFNIAGYSFEAMSTNNTNDLRFILEKVVYDENTKKCSLETLEDFGIRSNVTGNQLVDHLRGTRSVNPNVSSIMPNNRKFNLNQNDFNDYFAHFENIVFGTKGEGFRIRLTGEIGGFSNIDFVGVELFTQILKRL